MTIVKLKGGLGNQLFQYAFGRLIAERKGERLLLDSGSFFAPGDTPREYALGDFNIAADFATGEIIKKYKYPLGRMSAFSRFIEAKFLRRFHIGFEPAMLKTGRQYLEGFFQSYKYLYPLRVKLLEEISLKGEASAEYKKLSGEIAADSASIAVHIRRGDYVSHANTRAAHLVCDLDYYVRAMDAMKVKMQNPSFYIFSDDIEWARSNMDSKYNCRFISRPGLRDSEELMLMSLCRHNIISNSSFSFWGAWLNRHEGKTVIAPTIWNKVLNSAYRETLPPDWIRI